MIYNVVLIFFYTSELFPNTLVYSGNSNDIFFVRKIKVKNTTEMQSFLLCVCGVGSDRSNISAQ